MGQKWGENTRSLSPPRDEISVPEYACVVRVNRGAD